MAGVLGFLFVIVLIAWAAFTGWIGWTIGETRGRETLGLVLGLVVGPLGWITIAVMEPTKAIADRDRKLQAMENAIQMARILGLETP